MAEKYNYLEAVKSGVETYIDDEIEIANWTGKRAELEEKLYSDLWDNDSVTGNGSGSYTFNSWQAEEYICHNLDLLAEALQESGHKVDILEKGAEWCDVVIRCYLLGQAITESLDKLGIA